MCYAGRVLGLTSIVHSGHEVPAYTHGTLAVGEAALQLYSQIMSNHSLSSTGSQSGATDGTGSAVGQPSSQPNSSPLGSSSVWTLLGSALLGFAVLPF